MAVPTGSPVSWDEDLPHDAPQAPSYYYYLITTLSTTCDRWARCFSLRARFHLVSLLCGASGQGLPCGVSVPLRGTLEGRQAGPPNPNTLSDSEDRAARDKEKHGPPQGLWKTTQCNFSLKTEMAPAFRNFRVNNLKRGDFQGKRPPWQQEGRPLLHSQPASPSHKTGIMKSMGRPVMRTTFQPPGCTVSTEQRPMSPPSLLHFLG